MPRFFVRTNRLDRLEQLILSPAFPPQRYEQREANDPAGRISRRCRLPQREEVNEAGGADHESESNTGLYRMQAPQLCDKEEQAEQSGTD